MLMNLRISIVHKCLPCFFHNIKRFTTKKCISLFNPCYKIFLRQSGVQYLSTSSEKSNNLNQSLKLENKILTIKWTDSSVSRFHSIWLRHHCQCSSCQQEFSNQKLIHVLSLPKTFTLQHAEIKGNKLHLLWKEDSHQGSIDLSWLKNNCYSEQARKNRTQERRMIFKKDRFLPTMSYEELMDKNSGLLSLFEYMINDGLCLISNVPCENNIVKCVAQLIGPVQKTIYGEIFDVINTEKPINIAYTSASLPFHVDLPYYESPPGVQLLHCLRKDVCVQGGESTFLDGFHMAEEFRLAFPDHFFNLTRIPGTFQKIHYDREWPIHITYQRPHIVLNHEKEIVAVNWSPSFEGPLCVAENDIEPYYQAYQCFFEMIESSDKIIERQLHSGDMIIFNNRRMLHGRKSFNLNGGIRHLQGCYIHVDEFKSQAQIAYNKYKSKATVLRVGNQDFS